jgi:hypothetical protein
MNKIDKDTIKSLLKDSKWESILRASAELTDKWLNSNVIGESQYETLKLTFSKEFKVQGVRDFLNFLEEEALN